MKVLVFGNGWLGSRIGEEFDAPVVSTDIRSLDVERDIRRYRPDVVVNAAAMCPSVEWCEKPENRWETGDVNALGPKLLQCCVQRVRRKAQFVHLSTGCLWETGKDLTEKDMVDPPSWYATTKVMGENSLDLEHSMVVRLRMPIDDRSHPRNLLNKLVKYEELLKLQNSITVVPDFLRALRQMMEKGCTGVYNVVNQGSISPYEIVAMYAEMVDNFHSFRAADEGMAVGRANLTLSTAKLKAEGIELPEVRKSVRECMRYMKEWAR